jgi:hypothetical protein
MVALRGGGLSPKAQVLGDNAGARPAIPAAGDFVVLAHVFRVAAIIAAFALLPDAAWAAELDGRSLSLLWALPFVGILLSIALFPLLAPHAWEHHQGKIAAGWALLVLVPMALAYGAGTALGALVHTALLEYIPFILLLLALFTVAGGIVIRGNIHGAPVANTVLILIGMVLASFIGTTGASMVMIRPVMRANDDEGRARC